MHTRPIERASFEQFTNAIASLNPLIQNHDISEIMVNNHESIWIERNGRMEKTDVVIEPNLVRMAIIYLASGSGISAAVGGTASGIVNAAYENLRIASIMYPTAMDGDAICIRKHGKSNYAPEQYVEFGSFDRTRIAQEKNRGEEEIQITPHIENSELIAFIKQEINKRKNFLIAGGTNAGKTSLLNMFMGFIPNSQRVITIEDTRELEVKVPNKVRLLSNRSQGVTSQLLVEQCLRFRPDRIVVGEVRGGEAKDFLDALNTGHDGGFASLHAKNADLTLSRLENLVTRGLPSGISMPPEVIRQDIANCIDYVIHFQKSPTSSFRYLNEMIQLLNVVNGRYVTKPIFNV
ncbi:CpaF family protein [Undibacterium oligocarboniphilum]|uniref:CpaF family protein n=1 Tax=Undibacterium oligocarboniphilum TaxID=666702 RepID=A0A850QMZ1_9BURK|nr:ATPase, T2SS/T4P/T4SS family [Undibacterium oligocarboniphilum]MBC3871409.1 CpaF family protein [Undibacterium oligocarboniphilum]NVO79015.1 CpaF family protein [Undibacterium oligocarboniphilum]